MGSAKHFTGIEFFREGVAKGEIVAFSEKKYFNNIKKEKILSMLEILQESRFDEIERFVDTLRPLDVYIGDKSMISMFLFSRIDIFGFIEDIKLEEEMLYNLKEDFLKYIEKSIEKNENKDYVLSEEQNVQLKKTCLQFANELLDNLTRRKLADVLKSNSENIILYVNELTIQHFDYLPDNLTAIIFSKSKLDEKFIGYISNDFLVPIVKTNVEFKNGDNVIIDGFSSHIIVDPTEEDIIKANKLLNDNTFTAGEKAPFEPTKILFFSPINGTYNIEKILSPGWYNGAGLVKTEYLYYTKGRIPSKAEIYDYFFEIFTKFKDQEIHLSLPDFREEKPVDYLDDITIDIPTCLRNSDLFSNLFDSLAFASRDVGVNPRIYVPYIRIEEEIEFWQNKIENTFDYHDVLMPEVCIALETETAYQNYLDYDYCKFTVINLDTLLEEVTDYYDRFSEISVEEFMKIFVPQIRDIHQHYRKRHYVTKHIVKGNCLSNPDIFYKMLKMGFYNFSIPHDRMRLVIAPMEKFKKSYIRWVRLPKE